MISGESAVIFFTKNKNNELKIKYKFLKINYLIDFC